jgi:DNA-binding beta-propeller fold protein YncE
MRLGRNRYLVGAVIAVLFTAAGGSIQAGATSRTVTHAERSSETGAVRVATGSNPRGTFGSALLASAPVAVGPSALAVDTATDTIYSANGSNANGTSPGGDTVSVIDGRHCQAQDVSRCKGPWPTIRVGNMPSTITVDEATDTVYVTINGNAGTTNAVSVFNGAICNGRVTWGCDQTPARVRVGSFPFGIFADSSNHTVYVTSLGGDIVSMINSSTCNAADLTGCSRQTPATVTVGGGPGDIAVNQSTHTVYVAENGGVSAFDANTCNATVQTGCGTVGMLNGAPAVSGVTVDAANDTIYTADYSTRSGGGTMSAFDGRSCNASDLAECAAQKRGIVAVAPPQPFETAFFLTVDVPRHTVYVVNQGDDDLSVIDTQVCNGRHLAACTTLNPPTIHTGEDPEFVAVNTLTQTLYTANQVSNEVSVIDASRCDAGNTSGCRRPAPAVSIPQAFGLAVDTTVQTAYVTSGANAVALIDTRACNSHRLAGCTAPPPTVAVGPNPAGVAVDQRTHTVFVADQGTGPGSGGGVSVINADSCNAGNQAGCGRVEMLNVPGGNPDGIAVDPATDTVYVTTITGSGPNLISVFNGATCDAENTSGCGQTPATLHVGQSDPVNGSDLSVAISQETNTLYVTNVDYGNQTADTVYVINGTTCDAADTSGCGKTPATITVGEDPRELAIDPKTDTIYVANHAQGDLQGTVSVINGAICNGSDTSDCGQTPPTVAAGYGAVGIALDAANDTIYVTNVQDTSVSVINGSTCNGGDHSGCGQRRPRVAVGRAPWNIAVDQGDASAYVVNLDGTVSVIPVRR